MLSPRQKRFIVAAHLATEGKQGFNFNVVARKLGTDYEDVQDLAISVNKLGYIEALGWSDTALLSPDGRTLARDLLEQGYDEGLLE